MTPPPLLSSFATVGNAVWLYEWLVVYTRPANARWQVVANGEAMSDERIACHIDVSASMVRRWRERLEKLGYIRTEIARPRYRRYWLINPSVEEVPAEAAAESLETPLVVN